MNAIDPRLNADPAVVNELNATMGWRKCDSTQYVAISMIMVAKDGKRYMLGNMGQFVDRTFALKFMDENPDMFPAQADREYALTLVRSEKTSIKTYEALEV